MTLTDYMCQEKEKEDTPEYKRNVDASIRRVEEENIRKSKEKLVRTTSNSTDYKRKNTTKTMKEKWNEMKYIWMCISSEKLAKSRTQKPGYSYGREILTKKKTLLIVPLKKAMRTNYINVKIHNMQLNTKCRLCGDWDETGDHIISKCS